MNQRARFIRKIVYACIIAALLLPLSWLSAPATTESDGGILAQMREENHLSQADLGEIDPTSETIKLATLGMRGVAVNLLWEKANQYMREEDWANLSATLEQMTRLQPNFVTVWAYQGWNLSYNVSVEFDDYHDRYRWVIKGINFLKRGTEYNRDEPRLLTDIGWTIAHKIGTADERVQYRRLFREDDDFNGARPLAQRDNWLVGREWLGKAEAVVAKGVAVKGNTPLLFYSRPPMCYIKYAEALEEDGTFGEVAKNAWIKAAEAWDEFANRDLPTQSGFFIRLSEKEEYDKKMAEASARLDNLAPGIRETVAADKLAALSDDERTAYELPPARRSRKQQDMIYHIVRKLEVQFDEIAERVQGSNRADALKAAQDANDAQAVSNAIDGDREIVNFNVWKLRCEFEPVDDTLAARKLTYDGDRELAEARIPEAEALYVEGLDKWRKVLDRFPDLLKDSLLVEDLMVSVNHYKTVLHQSSKPFPQPFVLQNVIDADAVFHAPPVAPAKPAAATDAAKSTEAKEDEAKPAAAQSAEETKTPEEPEPPESTPAASDKSKE